jgi:Domain of unknown function (DUF4266)
MKKFITLSSVLLLIGSSCILHSCTSPKADQKIYLNDAEMELAPRKAEKFEMNFQVYREGASGANGGKTGGGCGCN